MRLSDKYVLRSLGDKHIIVKNSSSVDLSHILTFNDSAAFLWNAAAGHDFSEEHLVGRLLEEYDVDSATASEAVREIVKLWREKGLVED